MRGKWLIAGIAIILGILSVRQLSYTWYTNKVESEAHNLANDEHHEEEVEEVTPPRPRRKPVY